MSSFIDDIAMDGQGNLLVLGRSKNSTGGWLVMVDPSDPATASGACKYTFVASLTKDVGQTWSGLAAGLFTNQFYAMGRGRVLQITLTAPSGTVNAVITIGSSASFPAFRAMASGDLAVGPDKQLYIVQVWRMRPQLCVPTSLHVAEHGAWHIPLVPLHA